MNDVRLFRRLASVAVLLSSLTVRGDIERVGTWFARLPSAVLKRLPMAQRNCAERAERQMESGSYRAAAAEWERFEIDHVSAACEATLAWTMTLRARCLARAHDVNRALEVYGDEIELYPDQTATACALYWRAAARASNGDLTGAAADLDALVASEAYAASPVLYAARNAKAVRLLKGGDLAAARAALQKTVDAPRDVNAGSWDEAKAKLTVLDRLEHPEQIVAEGGEALGDLSRRVAREDEFVLAYFNLRRGAAASGRAAAEVWLKDVSEKLAKNLVSSVAATAKPDERQAKALKAIDLLVNLRHLDEAKALLVHVEDPVKRAFAGARIGWAANDGKFVAFSLADAEASPDAETAARAKREHAWACQRLLRDYAKAIRLYEEAPQPPETLWRVAECQRALGQSAKAQGLLDELCGVFPHEAAAAMLRKGDWYREDGDRKRAIACYRQILSHPEWKKSASASPAHQRLEAYGVATGGAVRADRN